MIWHLQINWGPQVKGNHNLTPRSRKSVIWGLQIRDIIWDTQIKKASEGVRSLCEKPKFGKRLPWNGAPFRKRLISQRFWTGFKVAQSCGFPFRAPLPSSPGMRRAGHPRRCSAAVRVNIMLPNSGRRPAGYFRGWGLLRLCQKITEMLVGIVQIPDTYRMNL